MIESSHHKPASLLAGMLIPKKNSLVLSSPKFLSDAAGVLPNKLPASNETLTSNHILKAVRYPELNKE